MPPKPRFKKTQRRQEIDELKRKFQVTPIDDETFQVLVPPSDPDFVLPIAVLDCDFVVPRHYPHNGIVKLRINNKDIPRGYALNAEMAFLKYTGSLKDRAARLDQELEELLTMPPQPTVTIVKSRIRKGPLKAAESVPEPAPEPDVDPELSDVSSYYSDSDDDSDTSSDSELSDGSAERNAGQSGEHSGPKPRGTELVLPRIAMNNLSLVEITSLNLVVKCGRCKHANEFLNMTSPPYGDEARPRSKACERCSLPLAVAYRKEYLHSFSETAGFLDVSGGTFIDMLPSTFLGTCSECNEPVLPFKNLDFGKNVVQVCRSCHKKVSLTVDQFRFDVITTGDISASRDVKAPPSEKLKLQGGQPLPNDGACQHYKKSLRWFRFTCCKRVFPCDRCHDAEAGHPCEPANRMICGKCSKEQHFAPECRFCHHSFSTRRTAFWEGGKGTRDRTKMSRKDPRKYKKKV